MLYLATHLLQDLKTHLTHLSRFAYEMDQQKSSSLSVLQALLTCHCLARAWVALGGCSW